jgi:hypothetical protein
MLEKALQHCPGFRVRECLEEVHPSETALRGGFPFSGPCRPHPARGGRKSRRPSPRWSAVHLADGPARSDRRVGAHARLQRRPCVRGARRVARAPTARCRTVAVDRHGAAAIGFPAGGIALRRRSPHRHRKVRLRTLGSGRASAPPQPLGRLLRRVNASLGLACAGFLPHGNGGRDRRPRRLRGGRRRLGRWSSDRTRS